MDVDDIIKPLNRKSIYEEVLKEIIQLIKSEEWKQGERIPGEVALAEAFGISRNSVREALKALELSGVISARAGRGTFLSENAMNNIRRMELTWVLRDSDSLEELIQTRLIIEPELVALAAKNATKEDIDEMHRIIDYTISIIEEDQYTIEEGMKFHLKMMKSSKNHLLYKFMNSITDELCVHRFLRAKKYIDKNLLLEEMGEHRLLVELIAAGEVEKARELAVKHVYRAKDFYYEDE
jgi:GntR family transcriptional repressor for pyruvate dehydrogenase complex